jgi:hypothetical protein
LSHMNQPIGSCHSHFREVVNLAEELRKRGKQRRLSASDRQPASVLHCQENDLLAASPVQEFSELDRMEIENQLELEVDGGSHGHHGHVIEVFEGSSKTYGKGRTFMAQFDYDRFANERTVNLYYPFASREEWELASSLLCSSLSMRAIDEFLSLNLVRPKFHWKIPS